MSEYMIRKFHPVGQGALFSIIYHNFFTNYESYSLKWEIIKRYEKVILAELIKGLSEYEKFEDQNDE